MALVRAEAFEALTTTTTPSLTRRGVLGAALLVAAPWSPRAQAASRPEPVFGVQLYTLQKLAASGLENCLQRVAAAGFRSVEFAGFSAYGPEQISKALSDAGLSASGAHCLPLTLSNEDAVRQMDFCARAGIRRVVTALPSGRPDASGRRPSITSVFTGMTADDLQWSAARMNAFAARAQGLGLQYAYHTHNLDFRPVAGATILDGLMRLTDGSSVSLELDVGNLVAAGADPFQILTRYRDRLCAVHLKDWSPGFAPSFDLRFPAPAPFGTGVIDWARLLPAIETTGVRDLIIEQEAAPGVDPLEAQAQALGYLRSLRP